MHYNKNVTQLLMAWQEGSEGALKELMPLVYQELCIIARSHLKKERPHHTLNTVALVNEAYVRLCSQNDLNFQSRAHFFGIAARTMRQILVDYARECQAEKRGGQRERIFAENIDGFSKEKAIELVKLDEALKNLAQIDEKKCRIVEMRYFGGLTLAETAQVLKTSIATLKREWAIAKAWLLRDISEKK